MTRAIRFPAFNRVFRSTVLLFAALAASPLAAQVQIRLPDAGHGTYSELHDGLRVPSPAADSVRRLLASEDPDALWSYLEAVLSGSSTDWNSALIALTRLAMLRDARSVERVDELRRQLAEAGPIPFPRNPGVTAADVEPSLTAITLEYRRKVAGDSAVLAEILARIPTRRYDHGDAWVLGRLGAAARDSVVRRFREAPDEEFRVRYLTLLSYFADPELIPLFKRIHAAPDSFGVPRRYAVRASDGLCWVGTREAFAALLEAREIAARRGIYADSSLRRGGYSFLENDSSAVVSRTGRWATEWIRVLSSGSPPRTPRPTR